jgi:hypothetical protein
MDMDMDYMMGCSDENDLVPVSQYTSLARSDFQARKSGCMLQGWLQGSKCVQECDYRGGVIRT